MSMEILTKQSELELPQFESQERWNNHEKEVVLLDIKSKMESDIVTRIKNHKQKKEDRITIRKTNETQK
jgi:hypothetical protein